MSGYGSKVEAMEVLKATIVMNAGSIPSGDPKDYYIGAFFDDHYYQWSGGWGIAAPSFEEFAALAEKHLRPAARRRTCMGRMPR